MRCLRFASLSAPSPLLIGSDVGVTGKTGDFAVLSDLLFLVFALLDRLFEFTVPLIEIVFVEARTNCDSVSGLHASVLLLTFFFAFSGVPLNDSSVLKFGLITVLRFTERIDQR